MLKVDPQLPTKLLMTLLMNNVALDKAITSQYMANFRRRCAIFHATNPDYVKLNRSDSIKLTNTSRISSKEENSLLVPNINSNSGAMFATLVRFGTQTWKALAYLNELKNKLV